MAVKSKIKIKRSPEKAIKYLENMNNRFKGPDSVKVGLPKGSNNYPDGTSIIMIGAVHEFGSPSRGVPERSFLRSTLNDNKLKYKIKFKKLSKSIVSGLITKNKALQILGAQLQSDVIGTISLGISPELKSREGTPLRDTGHLIQSITFQVDD